MKRITIIIISALLSFSLISVGLWGALVEEPVETKDIEWVPSWVPDVKIPSINDKLNKVFDKEDDTTTPVDKNFQNMKEFSVKKEEVKPDGIVKGTVPLGEIKTDRGKLIKKGTNTTITCSNLKPNTVYIPTIQLYSPITNKGKLGTFDKEGYFNLPDRYDVSTKWVDSAKLTDNNGLTLLAAHRTFSGRYGVFNNLVNVKKGAIACVSDSKGHVQKYAINKLSSYSKNKLPQNIFNNPKDGDKRLVMITCAGTLVRKQTGGYTFDSNVIATFTAID